MRQYDDRGARALALEVAFEPFELRRAERAAGSRGEAEYVDEGDEMHPALGKAVPAARCRALGAEALEIALAVVADDVVLARDVVGIELGALHQLGGGVELGRLRQMGHVAGMDQHRRRLR